MNVKFDFRDLNYLQFVTKHIQFGWYNSHGLQTAIYYEVTSYLRSFVFFVLHTEWNKVSFVTDPVIGREIGIQPIKSDVLIGLSTQLSGWVFM